MTCEWCRSQPCVCADHVFPDPFGERARVGCEAAREVAVRVGPRAELDALLATAGPDEVRVLLYIAQRLIGVGQRQYGRLSIATDHRDFRAEAAAEFGDGAVYLAIEGLRRTVG